MLSLQIQARKNRVKDANYHQTIFQIQHRIHVDTTIIHQVPQTITIIKDLVMVCCYSDDRMEDSNAKI